MDDAAALLCNLHTIAADQSSQSECEFSKPARLNILMYTPTALQDWSSRILFEQCGETQPAHQLTHGALNHIQDEFFCQQVHAYVEDAIEGLVSSFLELSF